MRLHKNILATGRRYWLYGNNQSGNCKQQPLLSWEWYPGGREFGIGLGLHADCERTISSNIKIPFVGSLYISKDGRFGYSDWWRELLRLDDARKNDGRQFGFHWQQSFGAMSGGNFSLQLGAYTNCWSSKDAKWTSMSFTPQQFFCGKYSCSDRDISTHQKTIVMQGSHGYPTQSYDLECRVYETTWTWPRFKKPFVMRRSEVRCEQGIAHPGKGSCDYNCGEDALYGSTTPEGDPDKAFDKFITGAQWYRDNYPT